MNKKLKMVITLAMTVAMAVSLATGCKKEPKAPVDSKPDTSKEVKLKSYFIGDPGKNEAEVLTEVNKVLKDKINATIEYANVSWGDWKTKFPVLLASGEPFDLIYTANWCYYLSESPKGAYYALDDLLDKYAPSVKKNIPAEAWEQAKVNGKIYMVPSVYPNIGTFGAVVRGDLRKKYNIPEIKNIETYGAYLEAIKKNEPDLVAFNANTSNPLYNIFLYENEWGRPSAFGNGEEGVITYDILKGGKPIDVTTTKEYEAFIKRQKEWADKGYWTKGVLSNKTRPMDAYRAGNSASFISNLGTTNQQFEWEITNNKNWNSEWFPMENGTKIERSPYISNGTAIYSGSKNPERALMFIELLHSNKDFYELVMHGVKGKNWEAVDGQKWKLPAGVNPADVTMTNTGMGLMQALFQRDNVNKSTFVINKEKEYDKVAVMPKYAAFVLDQTPISAELAAINSVCTTYKAPLDWGLVDPVTGLATLKQKLKEAGLEKVLTEVNKQLDAYNSKK